MTIHFSKRVFPYWCVVLADMATVRKMEGIVPEYKSNNSVYELLEGANQTQARKLVFLIL